MALKIEEYLQSLPQGIMSGEDVQLNEHSLKEIFEFVELRTDDIFPFLPVH